MRKIFSVLKNFEFQFLKKELVIFEKRAKKAPLRRNILDSQRRKGRKFFFESKEKGTKGRFQVSL